MRRFDEFMPVTKPLRMAFLFGAENFKHIKYAFSTHMTLVAVAVRHTFLARTIQWIERQPSLVSSLLKRENIQRVVRIPYKEIFIQYH